MVVGILDMVDKLDSLEDMLDLSSTYHAGRIVKGHTVQRAGRPGNLYDMWKMSGMSSKLSNLSVMSAMFIIIQSAVIKPYSPLLVVSCGIRAS